MDTETDGEDAQGREWRKSGKANQGKSRTAGRFQKLGKCREGLEIACVNQQKLEACRWQLFALFHSKAIEILRSMVHCLCSAGSIWEALAACFEAWLEGS